MVHNLEQFGEFLTMLYTHVTSIIMTMWNTLQLPPANLKSILPHFWYLRQPVICIPSPLTKTQVGNFKNYEPLRYPSNSLLRKLNIVLTLKVKYLAISHC